MSRLDEIRTRANAALAGPWRWFGNTETEMVYLATVDRGRIYVLMPTIERTEGYRRSEDPYDFIGVREYQELAPDLQSLYSYEVKAELHLCFQDHERGLVRSHRRIARYEVLNGRTREEAGLAPDADRSNSPLYREDLVGLDNPEAEFIAHAREDVDYLLSEIDLLNARLAEAHA